MHFSEVIPRVSRVSAHEPQQIFLFLRREPQPASTPLEELTKERSTVFHRFGGGGVVLR